MILATTLVSFLQFQGKFVCYGEEIFHYTRVAIELETEAIPGSFVPWLAGRHMTICLGKSRFMPVTQSKY